MDAMGGGEWLSLALEYLLQFRFSLLLLASSDFPCCCLQEPLCPCHILAMYKKRGDSAHVSHGLSDSLVYVTAFGGLLAAPIAFVPGDRSEDSDTETITCSHLQTLWPGECTAPAVGLCLALCHVSNAFLCTAGEFVFGRCRALRKITLGRGSRSLPRAAGARTRAGRGPGCPCRARAGEGG